MLHLPTTAFAIGPSYNSTFSHTHLTILSPQPPLPRKRPLLFDIPGSRGRQATGQHHHKDHYDARGRVVQPHAVRSRERRGIDLCGCGSREKSKQGKINCQEKVQRYEFGFFFFFFFYILDFGQSSSAAFFLFDLDAIHSTCLLNMIAPMSSRW